MGLVVGLQLSSAAQLLGGAFLVGSLADAAAVGPALKALTSSALPQPLLATLASPRIKATQQVQSILLLVAIVAWTLAMQHWYCDTEQELHCSAALLEYRSIATHAPSTCCRLPVSWTRCNTCTVRSLGCTVHLLFATICAEAFC